MSGSTASFGYVSPVNFRISQQIPNADQLGDALPAVDELYTFAQQAISVFQLYCGISIRNPKQWSDLAGSPVTLLSGNLNRLYVKASENLVVGNLVHLFNNAGTLEAQLANATDSSKPCDGFVSFVNIASGDIGEIQLHSGLINVGGVTIGQRYWLSTISGLLQNIPATGAGNIEQYIGIGIDTSHVAANIAYPVQH